MKNYTRILCIVLSIVILFTSINIPVRANEFVDNNEVTEYIEDDKIAVSDNTLENDEDYNFNLSENSLEYIENTVGTIEENLVQSSGEICIANTGEELTIIAQGDCGENLEWTIYDNGDLCITGTGAMYNYDIRSAPWYEYRFSISNLILADSITSIGNYAFYYINIGGTLVLPKALTSIGEYAFAVAQGVEGDLIIPDGVKEIGSYAFEYCDFNGELYLPKGLEIIRKYAFVGCESFVGDLIMPDSVKFIEKGAFSECGFDGKLILPSDLEIIPSECFCNCSNLKSILNFPSNLKTIEDYAFSECTNISGELILPNSIVSIESGAFSKLLSIKTVYLPSGISVVNEYVFYGCESLEKVYIPKEITRIEDAAFIFTSKLKDVYFLGTPEEWENVLINGYCSLLSATMHYEGYNNVIFISSEKDSTTVYIEEGSLIAQPQNPSKEFYEFTGWYTSDSNQTSETLWNFDTDVVTSDVTLYAGWKKINVKINLDYCGGEGNEEYFLKYYGDYYPSLPIPIRKGYKFLGWYTDKIGGTQITSKIQILNKNEHTLYAHWSADEYKLSLDASGGTVDFISKPLLYGDKYGSLPIPSKGKCTFEGWYTDRVGGDKITEDSLFLLERDVTLYAHWSGDDVVVTFDACGGVSDVETLETKYKNLYGDLPIPQRECHTFLGWFTSMEGGEQITSDTVVEYVGNITLYAHWEIFEYNVVLYANGGNFGKTGVLSYIVKHGEKIEGYKEPVYDWRKFIGWFDENNQEVCITDAVTQNMNLYAKWKMKYAVDSPKANIENMSEVYYGTGLKLTSSTNGATIFYTLDGSDPSETNGNLYEDLIEIKEDVIIKAIAVKDNYQSSDISCFNYTIIDESTDWGDIDDKDKEEQGFLTTDDIPQSLWVSGVYDCDYTGGKITHPELHVYSYKTLLQENIDYSVKYKNNINAGTASVTITGKGNYTGTIEKYFTIRPLNLNNTKLEDVVLAYTGKVQKANTNVTYELNGKKVTLKNGKDFSCTYPKTEINATDYDSNAFKEPGTYAVILNGIGNYYTSENNPVTYNVTISKSPIISKMKIAQINDQEYTGSAIEPEITLMNGQNKLVGCKIEDYTENVDVDFTIKYENNIEVGLAEVIIEGKGDYLGTIHTTFKITGRPLDKTKLNGFTNSLPWCAEGVKQNVTFSCDVGSGSEKTTKYLTENIDYTVEYINNHNIGTATVIFTGKAGYTGVVKKTYKITGYNLTNAEISGLETTMKYDCREKTQNNYILTYTYGKDDNAETVTLVEGKDYVVSYQNTEKVGNAKIIFTGINAFTGKIQKSYTITPYYIDSEDGKVSVSEIEEQRYVKGGSTPKPLVTYTDDDITVLLVEGKDYDLKYSNNKDISDKESNVIITGKGNFKGSLTRKYKIIGSDLSSTTMVAKDIVFQNKSNIYKVNITVYDTDGSKLKAGTDYDKTIDYTYAKDVQVTQIINKNSVSIMRLEGEKVDTNDIIPVGAEIMATATGINNYKGSKDSPSTQSVVIRCVAGDLSKAKITVSTQIYTGKSIEPTKKDIIVKVGTTVVNKADYEIINCNNNIKKGNGTLTIRGIGNYGGEKTVSFKIDNCSMCYNIIFDSNGGNGKAKKMSLAVEQGNLLVNQFTKKGAEFVGWNTEKDGSGVWYFDQQLVSSKGNYGKILCLYAQWEIIDYSITYHLNGGENNSNNPSYYNVITPNIHLKSPNKMYYKFEGWYKEPTYKTKVDVISNGSTGDIVLYAKWVPLKYNITFSPNGGSGSVKAMSNLEYGSYYVLTPNSFTRNGYTFVGWNTKPNGTGDSYNNQQRISNLLDKDGATLVLYAMWSLNTYKISYVLNGGTNNAGNPTSYNVNTNDIILKSPTKEYTAFGGWYKDSGYKNKITTISKGSIGNLTLYAKWEKYSYTIKFNSNGATSGTMSDMKCDYGSTYYLTNNAFKKNGYDFIGWNTKADGSGTSYSNGASINNLSSINGSTIILYAQWEKQKITPSVKSITINKGDSIIVNGENWIYQYSLYKGGSWYESRSWTTDREEIHNEFALGGLSAGTYTLYYYTCSFTRSVRYVYKDGQMVYESYYEPTFNNIATNTCKITVK